MLEITKSIHVPMREFRFSYARSQGPGGQNVNKVNSKATLRWAVAKNESLPPAVRYRFLSKYSNRITKEGDLVLTSQRYRDQPRNVQDCLDKLRDLIFKVSTAPKARRKSKPTKGSKVRRRKAKEANSQKKSMRKPPRMD